MTKEQRDEIINKIRNMPEEEFLELYKSAFEYDAKYKDFDEYCGCVKDGLNPGFCDEDCGECRQAWLNKKSDSTNHIENSMEILFDLVVEKQELSNKLDEIKLQLRDIDKKIELSKKEHADCLFEHIKPLLKNLEELGYFAKFQYGKSFRDPYTDSYYNTDNYYSLEKL